ncbi:hypothetical protein NW759_002866 [Fusarium solani]|nr:hypothetical protein NW759_002866 [Fusarium solani]
MAFGLSRLVSKARPRRRPRRPDALRNLKSNHVCFKIVRPRVWPPDSYDSPNNSTQPSQTKAKAKARIAREKLLSCTRSCHSLRRVPGRDKEEAECGTRVKE